MYRSWGTIQTDSVLDAMAIGVGGAVSHMKASIKTCANVRLVTAEKVSVGC
jgi:hypothetical protein